MSFYQNPFQSQHEYQPQYSYDPNDFRNFMGSRIPQGYRFPPEDKIPPLLPEQVGPTNVLLRMLAIWFSVFNITPMGGGKTFMTLFMAWFLRLPVVWFGPIVTESKVRQVARDFGVPVLAFYSYSSIAGSRKNQPANPFLDRVSVEHPKNPGSKDYFKPTLLFQQLVQLPRYENSFGVPL